MGLLPCFLRRVSRCPPRPLPSAPFAPLHETSPKKGPSLSYHSVVELEHPRATEQELLAEQVTDAEVRLIMERLSFEQFECPNATVGAVVEATGATPITIARILGQIRKTAFEERFNETFLVHEERLDHLEDKTELLDTRIRRAESRTVPRQVAVAQTERRTLDVIGVLFVLCLLVVGGCWVAGNLLPPRPYPNEFSTFPTLPSSGYTNPAGDTVTIDGRGDVTVRGSDGSHRQPTERERSEARGIRYILE